MKTGNTDLTIAIVGAGIAGLTTALALDKEGYKVRLYESAPAWGEIGAGITLSPNAMRGLDHIGIGNKIVASGIEPSTQEISHWQDGRVLLSVDRSATRESYGAAYVYIHRADLLTIFSEAIDSSNVDVYFGKRAASIEIGSTPVIRFADDSSAEADLVIGADGLKSVARSLYPAKTPYFTGHIVYRALAPLTPKIKHLIDQPGMHIGPGKMIVRYPLRQGSLLNLVFFTRQDGWTEDGWSIPAKISELENIYADWCPDIHTLIDSIQDDTIFKWAINAHTPLESWSIDSKVILTGDAAHAMTPFMGQGAATGIEDGVILARALSDSNTVKEGLERYQAARIERTSFIQLESNENADRLQGSESEMYGLGNLRNEETLGLFSYDCTTECI